MQETLVFDVETLYILIVLNFFRIAFFNGRFGQFGAIRVEYNQNGHLSYRTLKSSLKFLRFFFKIQADSFRRRGGWAHSTSSV